MGAMYLNVLWHSRVSWNDRCTCVEWMYLIPCIQVNIYGGGLKIWSLYLYLDNCSRRTTVVLWGTTASVWFIVDWCYESYWVFVFGLVHFCASNLFNYSLLVLFVPMSRPRGLLLWGALWNICVVERRPIPE